jgi:hypothetical protein
MKCAYGILYCHSWLALLCISVLHFLINSTIFEKKLLNIKCDLIFCISFVRNISHSKSNWARYDVKSKLVSVWGTRYCLQMLMKLEFFRQVFEQNPQISNFMKTMKWGSSFSMRTDGWTDMTKLILPYRNFENAPNIDLSRIKHKHYRNTYNANTRFNFSSVSIHVYLCSILLYLL